MSPIDPLGIPIFTSAWLPPGTVVVGRFPSLLPDRAESSLQIYPIPTWREQIRQIVRDGISAAYPDLVLPPKRTDLDPARARLSEMRMALMSAGGAPGFLDIIC